MRICLLFTLALVAMSCGGASSSNNVNVGNAAKTDADKASRGPVPVYTYEIVKTYPHDPRAFTEGLFFYDGFLYESTGQEGHSTLRKVNLETGKVVQQFELPGESFGEGISLLDGKIYQLTWREGICRVFDVKDFTLIKEFRYLGEGWGMTTDGTNLITSDGTHLLRFIDPQTFKTVRSVPVIQDNGKPLFLLNELEWVNGEIWANIWHSEDTETGTTQGRMPNIGRPNIIVRIDPASGRVLGWIDLAGISPDEVERDSENTLNGIAYDAATDRIFVTGKNWKKLFEIKIKPKEAS